MRGLADLLPALLRLFQQWTRLLMDLSAWENTVQAQPARLREVTGFGSNPGSLRMFAYVPDDLARTPAVVVILHGCLQTAAGYDYGAGWSTLADRYGFALLLPEQQMANNAQRCFNWFQREDSERDQGEAVSIRQMVEHMIRTHGIDRGRVFVTGLSAGGAMTSVMLATYPEVFAGGAIIAGVPYRCATGVPEALRCMFQGHVRSAREWGDLVRAASPHRGRWPRVSVWHGTSDRTVTAVNATEIIKQWTDVHGLPTSPTRQEMVDGHPRRVWENAAGEEIIEDYLIEGMDHGTPVAISTGEQRHGIAGPFLLDVGIASSYHIAKFWGVAEKKAVPAFRAGVDEEPALLAEAAAEPWLQRLRAGVKRGLQALGVLKGDRRP
jgi:poly(hydroxyalkanoate) depolymerase family esterase